MVLIELVFFGGVEYLLEAELIQGEIDLLFVRLENDKVLWAWSIALAKLFLISNVPLFVVKLFVKIFPFGGFTGLLLEDSGSFIREGCCAVYFLVPDSFSEGFSKEFTCLIGEDSNFFFS